ncbi:hypothetical protein C3B59_16355 [Cryobacterium zongtaii]|uniref:DNA/RNA non-specific endonuclease/pyrophosphatase/phosphodiesterase domain-containing protein n=2 Tax=Cryobacterium zongtaii TaxID=1259217 RepID=A0A2S3Z6C8_9MICO|nr:hypothetical protein C3B59_16355 [Cryobacterium zongtaii]
MRALPCTQLTVLLGSLRALVIATGGNSNGDQLVDVDQGNNWHLDPGVPADEQTKEATYARNDLDRGHLVRRQHPVWGDADALAQVANAHYPKRGGKLGAT